MEYEEKKIFAFVNGLNENNRDLILKNLSPEELKEIESIISSQANVTDEEITKIAESFLEEISNLRGKNER